MSFFQLVLRSLAFYWRTHLAVLLGVMAGSAVIGGALIVGDSVRGSLRQMTFDRLGDVDHVLQAPRFFREDLVGELANDPRFQERFETAAPVLMAMGSFESRHFQEGSSEAANADAKQESDTSPAIRRANKIQIFGVDARLWTLLETVGLDPPADGEVVLNEKLAEHLETDRGKDITLWLEIPSAIPRDSLLGKRENAAREVPLRVSAVLPEGAGAGRLSLNPSQQAPMIAFVALPHLQTQLDLAKSRRRLERERRYEEIPARVNSIFVRAKRRSDRQEKEAVEAATALTTWLGEKITLADLNLRVVSKSAPGYAALESEQQILSEPFAQAGEQAARKLGLKISPTLVYLANQITNVRDVNRYSRYSIVAGVDSWDRPPFGPYLLANGEKAVPLAAGKQSVYLNDWLATDLNVAAGDKISLTWHVVGSHGEIPEKEGIFEVSGVLKLDGTLAADRRITPDVRGITDVNTFAEWDAPFPMKKVTERDDDYWDRYRATPKLFLPLEVAQSLWKSRYGALTSLRVGRSDGSKPDQVAEQFRQEFLRTLQAEQTGMAFQSSKFEGLKAASGTTDFSGLFLGFSFFLILSAAILVGLLFRLGVERRVEQIGLLTALGFTRSKVSRGLLLEGMSVVVLGSLVGTAAGVGYAALMILGLKTWWIGAIGTKLLFLYVEPVSLIVGFLSSVVVAGLSIWWGMRQLRNLSARELLQGSTAVDPLSELMTASRAGRRLRKVLLRKLMGFCCLGGAGFLLGGGLLGVIPTQEAFSGFSWLVVSFFLSGILLLTGCMLLLSAWLEGEPGEVGESAKDSTGPEDLRKRLAPKRQELAVRGRGEIANARLAARNAGRNRSRSVLTTGLIASATFVLVAIASAHRDTARDEPNFNSGNGGFTLVAESSRPILFDINSEEGRKKLDLLPDEETAGGTPGPTPTESAAGKSARGQAAALAEMLNTMQVYPFRVRPGEDASCLNIYRTRVPTLLGATPAMIERGGFRLIGEKDSHLAWKRLEERTTTDDLPQALRKQLTLPEGESRPVYPVLGDMNTLQYSLKKGVGDLIAVPNDDAPQCYLQITAMFDSSVFQGVLVLSERNFLEAFPERSGYAYFLIDVPPEVSAELAVLLETRLNVYGFETQKVSQRIGEFLAVQNTYLSTFQTLGGLGLLLGTFGLSTVMLRNVLERREELALLRAVGFRKSQLSRLVLWENALLLVSGLSAGAVSALLSMLPHLAGTGGDIPWGMLLSMLGGIFAIGMLASLAAAYEANRLPILSLLRGE